MIIKDRLGLVQEDTDDDGRIKKLKKKKKFRIKLQQTT
jgi:hypothetical protein